MYDGKGYADVASVLTVTEATTPTMAATVSGYNGGAEIIIDGAGLNLESKALIGGRVYAELDLAQSSDAQLVFKAPPYYSKLVQETYGTLKEEKLTGTHVGDRSAEVEKAFDGKLSTSYQSSGTGTGYIGIDVGDLKKAVVTRVRYYYNTLPGFTLSTVKIQGSVDNSAWVDLHTFAS